MHAVRGVMLVVVLLVAPAGGAGASERIAIIVHAERSDALSAEQVGQVFLKIKRFWDNSSTILPVNRDAESSARATFTRRIFGDRGRRLSVYWNRQYFLGLLPPATMASDEAVKRFVQLERRAIGYIGASLVDDTVRVLFYIDPPRD